MKDWQYLYISVCVCISHTHTYVWIYIFLWTQSGNTAASNQTQQSILAVRKSPLDNIYVYFARSTLAALFQRPALAHFSFKGRWHFKKKTEQFNSRKSLNLQNGLCCCSSQTPPWSAGKQRAKSFCWVFYKRGFWQKLWLFFFASQWKVYFRLFCANGVFFSVCRGGKLMI